MFVSVTTSYTRTIPKAKVWRANYNGKSNQHIIFKTVFTLGQSTMVMYATLRFQNLPGHRSFILSSLRHSLLYIAGVRSDMTLGSSSTAITAIH